MSTCLNFNLSLRKKKQTRGHRATDHLQWSSLWQYNIGSNFALTKQLQLRWWRNRKAASVCYYLQFPWKKWKHERGEKPVRFKHFTLIPFFFLSARENNLNFSLLRNSSSLIYPFVFCYFYKVLFESIAIFWKYYNKL